MGNIFFNKTGTLSSWKNDVLQVGTSDCLEKRGGGLFFLHKSHEEIRGKIFVGNGYVKDGGGIYLNDCRNICIRDCIFLFNTAKWGGGIYVEKCRNIEICNNIFLFNFALRDGGAVSISHSHDILLRSNYFLANISLRKNRNIDILRSTGILEER